MSGKQAEQKGHVVNLLGALAVAGSDIQRASLEAQGLDVGTGAALLCVHTRAGLNISEIAQTAGLTHSGAVRAVIRLEQLRLVDRCHGRDRRTVEVTCTGRGTRVAQQLLRDRRAGLEAMLEPLTQGELVRFGAVVARILAALPSDRVQARHICRFCEHAVCRGEDCPVGSAVP